MIQLEISQAEAVILSRAIEAYDVLISDTLASYGVPVPLDRPAVTAGGKLAAALLMAGVVA